MAEEKTEKQGGFLKRRDLLKLITAAPAAALVRETPARAEQAMKMPKASAGEQAGGYQRKILNEHEWKTVHALSDLIIPADERSGSATQAGVPEFIDDWLDLRGGTLLAEIRGGLVWLDMECNRKFKRDFVDCSAPQQKQILDRIAYPPKAAPEDAAGVVFFNRMRDLVVSGFFSSKVGVKDLPYLGNQMVAEWNGCPAEVLAKLGFKG
jgi:gluconate 2-dehydrogenase subunit 3-like protein